MKIDLRSAVPFVALALMAVPAGAFAQVPDGTPTQDSNPGSEYQPSETPTGDDNEGTTRKPATPGPDASSKAKKRAYGKYCTDQGFSKKRVEGDTQRGTEFSRCVTAMAKVAADDVSPRRACRTLSKKRREGERRSDFSRCVSQARELRGDLREAEEQQDA